MEVAPAEVSASVDREASVRGGKARARKLSAEPVAEMGAVGVAEATGSGNANVCGKRARSRLELGRTSDLVLCDRPSL